MSRHPANVGRAPVNFSGFVLKYIAEGVAGIHHITAARVQHALRFSCASTGVENEQRIFTLHGHRFEMRCCIGAQFRIIDVTTFCHNHFPVHPVNHQHVLYRGALREGFIHDCFHRYLLRSAAHGIRSNHNLATAVVDAVGHGVGTKPGKHHRMDGSHASTGQHGIGQLGNHGHVDAHTVAFAYTQICEHVGHTAHFIVQLAVRNMFCIFMGFVGLPNDGSFVGLIFQMAVDAVFRDVEFRA